jgi:hypothetical protein
MDIIIKILDDFLVSIFDLDVFPWIDEFHPINLSGITICYSGTLSQEHTE